MKKLFILLFCVMLGGCTPVVRNNPTDPASSNYGGWTYIGEIGNFTKLTDFAIVYGTGQDYIFCLDAGEESMSRYLIDGTYDHMTLYNPTPPAAPFFIQPSGICVLGDYLYTVDGNIATINAFYISNLNNFYSRDIAAKGNRITSYNVVNPPHNNLYVAVSSTPAVYEYSSDTTGQTYTLQNSWTSSLSVTVSAISDIEIHSGSTTDVMIADPVNKIIAFYDLSGNFERTINIGTDIIGIAAYNDNIYVPTSNGILKIDYNSGAVLATIADYGNGNGRIIKPAIIRLYGTSYILVNNDTSIKYFQTNGL
jgi:hypothetical protein